MKKGDIILSVLGGSALIGAGFVADAFLYQSWNAGVATLQTVTTILWVMMIVVVADIVIGFAKKRQWRFSESDKLALAGAGMVVVQSLIGLTIFYAKMASMIH